MRRFASALAIVAAAVGLLVAWIGQFGWFGSLTAGVYGVVLLAAAVSTVRGGDLIYLAAAWALYVGMLLGPLAEVIDTMANEPQAGSHLVAGVLSIVLLMGVVGLIATFLAHRKAI